MSISVSRQSYWTVFYLSLALLYSCTGSDQASNQDQPCQGRCILPAICVESRCVYILDQELDAHIIDEPPVLLGDDTAPNPSEAVLAALGSCIAVGIHANCVFKGIDLYKLELELEGDINISAVWGTGDLVTEKIVGFSDIRVKAHVEGSASREELDEIVQHANVWSPVANTMRLPVNMTIESAKSEDEYTI